MANNKCCPRPGPNNDVAREKHIPFRRSLIGEGSFLLVVVMFRYLFSLFSAALASQAVAQIPGLTPLKANWIVPLDGGSWQDSEGQVVVTDELGSLVLVDVTAKKKTKLEVSTVSENDTMRLLGGRGWLWRGDTFHGIDPTTGRKLKLPVSPGESPERLVTATSEIMVVHPEGESFIEAIGCQDGAVKWKTDLPSKPVKTFDDPAAGFVVLDSAETATVVASADGKIIAERNHSANARIMMVAGVAGAAVLFELPMSGDLAVEGNVATVSALDLKTGKQLWTSAMNWPAGWGEGKFTETRTRVTALADRLYVDCGSDGDGVRVVVINAADGQMSDTVLMAPGLRMISLSAKGAQLCGDGVHLKELKGKGMATCVVGFDPATLKPIWLTEPLIGIARDHISTYGTDSVVVGKLPWSASAKARDFDSAGGISNFKLPSVGAAPKK
jgi:hypothetical protein